MLFVIDNGLDEGHFEKSVRLVSVHPDGSRSVYRAIDMLNARGFRHSQRLIMTVTGEVTALASQKPLTLTEFLDKFVLSSCTARHHEGFIAAARKLVDNWDYDVLGHVPPQILALTREAA